MQSARLQGEYHGGLRGAPAAGLRSGIAVIVDQCPAPVEQQEVEVVLVGQSLVRWAVDDLDVLAYLLADPIAREFVFEVRRERFLDEPDPRIVDTSLLDVVVERAIGFGLMVQELSGLLHVATVIRLLGGVSFGLAVRLPAFHLEESGTHLRPRSGELRGEPGEIQARAVLQSPHWWPHQFSVMSFAAQTKVLRGRRMIRSPGPHFTPGSGSRPI